jgi:hypothetical protein
MPTVPPVPVDAPPVFVTVKPLVVVMVVLVPVLSGDEDPQAITRGTARSASEVRIGA